jgi:hypothetical protein
MAKAILDTYRKAVLDAGISGKDWRKMEAFDEFTLYFKEAYSEEQRQSMKYDEILKIGKAWWEKHHSKYS